MNLTPRIRQRIPRLPWVWLLLILTIGVLASPPGRKVVGDSYILLQNAEGKRLQNLEHDNGDGTYSLGVYTATGGGGGGTQYTYNVAPPGSPVLTAMGGIRVDTPATLGTNGSWVYPTFDSLGALYVDWIGTLSSSVDSVAAVQSGTWTVQPGNTANTTPWLVTPGTANPTILYAAFTVSSNGDNTVVAAVSAKKIYVVSYVLNTAGTVNAKFRDDTAGADLSGLYYLAPNVGVVEHTDALPAGGFVPKFAAQTATNKPLVLNLSGAVAVSGTIRYYTQ